MRIFIMLVIALFSCKMKNQCERITNKEYKELVEKVKVKVKDLTWVEEPLSYPEMQNLLNNPECYAGVILDFIKENSRDTIGIELSLLGLRNLNFESTLKFSNKLFSLSIDEEIIGNWLTGLYGNRMFINSKNKTEIKRVINSLNPESENLKKAIEYISSN